LGDPEQGDGDADVGSPEAIDVPAEDEFLLLEADYIVSFVVPPNVPLFPEQAIMEGERAQNPGPALLPDPNPNNFIAFIGWYEEGASDDEPYSFEVPLTKNLTLYARYRTYFLVNYINAFNRIFLSKHVNPGEPVPALTMEEMSGFEAPVGEYFDHWERIDEGGNSLGVFYPGVDTVDSDANIRGVTAVNKHYVFFVSEGTQTPFQSVESGGFAIEPEKPSRAGYTFEYWADRDGRRFNFNRTPITADITLRARWRAEQTSFEVVFWKEKANVPDEEDSDPIARDPATGKPLQDQPNYTYYSSFTANALSGSELDKIDIDEIIGSKSSDYPAHSRYVSGDYSSNAETVLGSGTTIVNVYFRKIEYTVYFYIGNDYTNSSINGTNGEWPDKADRYTMQVGGATYGWSDLFIYMNGAPNAGNILDPLGEQALSRIKNGKHYYFKAKHEDYIGDKWPKIVDIKKDMSSSGGGSTPGNLYRVTHLAPSYPSGLAGWTSPRVTFDTDMIPPSGATEYIVSARWNPYTNVATLHYYIEDIENDSGINLPSIIRPSDPGYASRLYEEDTSLSVTLSKESSRKFEAKDIAGMVAISNGGITFDSAKGQYVPAEAEKNNIDILFFYNRNRYLLRFEVAGGSMPALNPALNYNTIKTGENLRRYIPSSNPTREEYGLSYDFEGWYYDPSYREPYLPNDKMLDQNITLYAKWGSSGHTIRQYDDMTTDRLVGTLQVERGEYVYTERLAYQPGENYEKGKFLGWRVYVDAEGNSAWFSFEAPIYTDLNLHAVWAEPAYRLIYVKDDPSIAGTVPEDKNEYVKGVFGRVLGNEGDGSGGRPLSKTGERFVGWQIDKEGVVYYRDNVVQVNGEIKLYPRFVPEGATGQVVYHSNNSYNLTVAQPTQKNSTIQMPDERIFLPTTFPGNELIGWASTSDGPTLYRPRDIYRYGTDDRVDMWAVWRYREMYDITFDTGEYGTTSDVTRFRAEYGRTMEQSGVVPPRVTADEEHRFVGWDPEFNPSEPVYGAKAFTAVYALLPELTPGAISIQPYDGSYTGTAHSVTVRANLPGSILFSEDGAAWRGENPAYINVNNSAPDNKYPVWVRYVVAGYRPYIAESYVRITKAPLTVTAPSREIDQYDPIPSDAAWRPGFSGFVPGEGEPVLGGARAIQVIGFVPGLVGDFVVRASGYTSNNYSIEYIDGVLHVKSAAGAGSITKQVFDEAKGEYVDLMYVDSREKTLRYRIQFVLPPSLAGYRNLEIQDLLPEALVFSEGPGKVGVTAVGGSGAPVPITGAVQVKYGGEAVSYAFAQTTDWAGLAGATVTMDVLTDIRPEAKPGTIINKARLLVNDDPANPTRPSDTPDSPSEEISGPTVVLTEAVGSVEKSVYSSAAGRYETERLYINDRAQTILYKIEFKVPSDIGSIGSIDIQDLLPAGIDIAYPANLPANGALQINGVPMAVDNSKFYYGSYSGVPGAEKVFGYTIDRDLAAIAGETVALFVETKLSGSVGKGPIVNTGRVLVNNSNPKDDRGPELFVVDLVEGFEKKVWDAAKGVYVSDNLQVNGRDETIKYIIGFRMPEDTSNYEGLQIIDEMPAALGLAGPIAGNVAVRVDGRDVTASGRLIERGRAVIYEFGAGTDYRLMAGAAVEMEVNAKVMPGPINGIIYNSAEVIVNESIADTDTGPGIVLTDPIERLEKTVKDPATGVHTSGTLQLSGKGQDLEYSIRFRLPEDTSNYERITIADVLPYGMRLAGGEDSISVSMAGVLLGPGEGSKHYDGGTNTVSFEFGPAGGFASLAGKAAEMLVRIRMDEDAGVSRYVNTAKVFVNGSNPQGITGPTVIVTEPVDGLEKLVKDPETGGYAERIQIDDPSQVLEYEIRFAMPADMDSVESITITDRMPAELALGTPGDPAASVGVLLDGSPFALAPGDLSYEPGPGGRGGSVSYTLHIADIKGMAGKGAAMRVSASIAAGAAGVITNSASVSVNGKNPETVTEGPVIVVEPVDGFEKLIYDPATGSYTDRLDLTDRSIELGYRISFSLPEDTTSYSSVRIIDIMPEGMVPAGDVHVSLDGEDITDDSKISVSGGAVEYLLDGGEGFFAGLAGAQVVMDLKARLSGDVQNGTLYNAARVLVNEKTPQDITGPALNISDPPNADPGPFRGLTKKIYSALDDAYVDSVNIVDRNAVLRYQISFILPDDMDGYNSLEIQDLLPEALRLAGTLDDSVLVAANGAPVAGGLVSTKYPDVGGGVASYVFDASAIAGLGGKTITMTILTRVAQGAANGSIANKGRVLVNEETAPGDSLSPPSQETEGPEVILIEGAKNFKKQIWDGETYVDYLAITDREESLRYRISFTLPEDMGGYRSIEMQDLLPEQLELYGELEDSVAVEVNGVKRAGEGLDMKYTDVGGGVVSYTFDEADIESLAGASVSMIVETRIRSGADREGIENKARLLINEKPGMPTKPEDTPRAPSEEVDGPGVGIHQGYTVTFDGNGGHVSGILVRYADYPDYTVDSLPRADRSGYNFVEWNTRRDGSGAMFNESTRVDSDMTVYARWVYITPDGPGPGAPETTPPPIYIPPDESTPVEEIPDEAPPLQDAPIAPAPPAEAPPPPPRAPVVTIAAPPTPLVAIEGPVWVTPPTITLPDIATPLAMEIPVWSLLNLMLAMLGCLIAIMLLVTAIRRKEDEYEEYRAVQEGEFLKILWRVLGVLSGVAGAVTFMLTENISNVMVMTDRWTPLMVMIEFAVLVFTFLLYRRGNDKDPDDDRIMFDWME
jgi:fimbrial isopeptide formation D2 family protein